MGTVQQDEEETMQMDNVFNFFFLFIVDSKVQEDQDDSLGGAFS